MRLAPLLLISLAAFASDRVEAIEFFGQKGSDVVKLRADLPVREGDVYTMQTKAQLRRVVGATSQIAVVCCGDNGGRLVFIGLKGANLREFVYSPAPTGAERLTPDIIALSKRVDKQFEAAVKRGGDSAAEDDSQGYALSHDPMLRAFQLQLRDWALEHEALTTAVLTRSGDVAHRRIASDILGYGRQSAAQVAVLVGAARDADGEVRNNATRALVVLVHSDRALAALIDPSTFIAMLNSGIWSDRNKAASLLAEITATRDAALLEKIRLESWDSLREMAAWRRLGHSLFARMILGRVAGVDEVKLGEAAMAGPDFFSRLAPPVR